jgi:hypothetical protein
VEIAPWTITQLHLGGTAILPMPVDKVDEAGLLPNRQISFWSYSRINDPRLSLRDDFSLFHAESLPPFKMGYFNPHGWLAYWMDGILFKKSFGAKADAKYPDNNSNAELYCSDEFVELESLSPLVKLEPACSTSHVEIWELFSNAGSIPNEIRATIGLL